MSIDHWHIWTFSSCYWALRFRLHRLYNNMRLVSDVLKAFISRYIKFMQTVNTFRADPSSQVLQFSLTSRIPMFGLSPDWCCPSQSCFIEVCSWPLFFPGGFTAVKIWAVSQSQKQNVSVLILRATLLSPLPYDTMLETKKNKLCLERDALSGGFHPTLYSW